MKAPVVKRVPGGIVVTAGFVPQREVCDWCARLLAEAFGSGVKPTGAEPAGIRVRTRPAEFGFDAKPLASLRKSPKDNGS